MTRVIVFCCLLSIPFMSFAQLTVSPKAGINYLWVGDRPQGLDRAGAEQGWQAGLDLRLGKRFYFQPGIYYVSTGASISSIEDIKNIKTGNASFMKIPVNVGYKLINSGIFKLRIHGGGVANKLIGTKDGGVLSASDFEPWNYGANVGAGIDLLFLTLDVNYEWGLTDMYSGGKNSLPTMAGISVGIKF